MEPSLFERRVGILKKIRILSGPGGQFERHVVFESTEFKPLKSDYIYFLKKFYRFKKDQLRHGQADRQNKTTKLFARIR